MQSWYTFKTWYFKFENSKILETLGPFFKNKHVKVLPLGGISDFLLFICSSETFFFAKNSSSIGSIHWCCTALLIYAYVNDAYYSILLPYHFKEPFGLYNFFITYYVLQNKCLVYCSLLTQTSSQIFYWLIPPT